jgi:hypothetical protein
VCRPSAFGKSVSALACGLALTSPARAATQAACFDAYEGSQILQRDGRLRAARKALITCADASCPAAIATECEQWLRQVESSLPSIVVAARAGDRDVSDVRVAVDGELLADHVEGNAIAVDPGKHLFRFERAPHAPIELEVVIRAGEKNRRLDVVFPVPTPAPVASRAQSPRELPSPSSVAPRPRHSPATFALGALGIGALAVGGYFDVRGYGEAQDLLNCSPHCAQSQADRAHAHLLIGDVTLGAGIVLTALAAWLFFAEAAQSSQAPAALRAGFGGFRF